MRSESDVLKSWGRNGPHAVKAFPPTWQANRMPHTRFRGIQRGAGSSPSSAANPQVKRMIAVSDPYRMPVAVLAPLSDSSSALQRLVSSGRARPPQGDLLDLASPREPVTTKGSDALRELREDRW
jgi:hypothetical protein